MDFKGILTCHEAASIIDSHISSIGRPRKKISMKFSRGTGGSFWPRFHQTSASRAAVNVILFTVFDICGVDSIMHEDSSTHAQEVRDSLEIGLSTMEGEPKEILYCHCLELQSDLQLQFFQIVDYIF
jgi:hypothetical protein